MSLNHKEIDLVLSEIDAVGMKIEKVQQPSYDSLILSLFGGGRALDLLISVAHGACRIHSLSLPAAKNERPLRFMECLRSRIRGGRIESCVQLGSDRIVKFTVAVQRWPETSKAGSGSAGPAPGPDRIETYYLYARLWSGAGNVLLVDESGKIVDSLVRNPKKGEVSGAVCAIETDLATRAAHPSSAGAKVFEVRRLEGKGNFSERVEAFYRSAAGEVSRENLIALARERYEKKLQGLKTRETELSQRLADFQNAKRYKEIGDILMAGYSVEPGPAAASEDAELAGPANRPQASAFAAAFDFFRGEDIKVQINPSLSNVENARRYYEKYKKAVSGRAELEDELEKCRKSQDALAGWLSSVEAEADPFAMAKALEKAGTVREKSERKYPCLFLEQGGWTYLVGRSAKENDEVLRRDAKGSDMWLHARGYSGSYVFIKAKKGKSFPLETLINAANLAVYYSKARKNLEADVFYTCAKYLRRVKDGPKGLVIPSQEKNLHIRLDENLVRSLLANARGREDGA